MSDYIEIKVQRYKTPGGAPTCCLDHPAGETCRFLGFRNLGTVDVCMATGADLFRSRKERYTIPPEIGCVVWPKESA
jgi:hypothetical protein